ncbi:choline dehydrogenase [Roseiarcaceae bacterium H3SJ34-1]|uniref:GMC family oxidoreductase n=1 Tax=Terripilifer ovatus TaxID=3032367 RepID=UPI003AB9ADDF|nr:choline dehydrogenase [Roseiarcaceae bacterium H3SJ34-1]
MPDDLSFDYIVIGAGSAGCVIANRLTEGEQKTVLLLEAGGWDRDPLIHIPVGVGKMFPERRHDWHYDALPDPNMDGRAIECARGKVIGGSSSVNVMAYVRGHRSDYDRWAAAGLTGWSYDSVLPYFKRLEDWEGGADAWRGAGGLMPVQKTKYADPLLQSFIAAGEGAGYPETTDYNGERQEGFGLIQETIRNGRRMSAATAYLKPARRRKSLRVEVNAHVTRIHLSQGRATGVSYSQNGRTVTAQAREEIIVSAGVINTPQILMLSGIGDAAKLQALGITPELDLPGVGLNLQDHISCFLQYRRRDTSPFHREMRYDRLALSMLRAAVTGRGFASDVPVGVTAFLKTRPDIVAPDVQLLFLAAAFPSRPYLRPFIAPVPDAFGCRVALLRPESRGSVSLVSADPMAAPAIHQNYLATQNDRDTLRAGLLMTREIVAQPEMSAHLLHETAPGADARDDAALDAFIRRTGVTVHHPVGTCRMGLASDRYAVVDPQLRLHNVENLRVVDASVMPDLTGGNINAVVLMIAEKAADHILGHPPLAKAATVESLLSGTA